MIYLDSSALVKLAHREPHSDALVDWLAARAGQGFTVSSGLARAETTRALRRSDPPALSQLPAVFARVLFLPIDDHIVAAGALDDPLLRTLDAIHLATARALGVPRLSFVAYDKRLLSAAAGYGFGAVSPGA